MKYMLCWGVLWLVLAFGGSALAASNNFQVGEGDVIEVMVYGSPDLTTTARINGDGSIIFPLIGRIHIGGLTVSQVAAEVAAALADGYLVSPQVSVFIQEFRSKKAVIMGQINDPGLYELSASTSLLELISKAGGLTPDAGDKVTIKRKIGTDGSEEKILTLNLRELLEQGNTSLDIAIRDGDSVFVTKAGIFYVTGEVSRPNAYRLEETSSVIKAITMAGGFTDIAAKNKVKIIRKVNGSEQIINNVPMHAPVLADDVIVVPESFF